MTTQLSTSKLSDNPECISIKFNILTSTVHLYCGVTAGVRRKAGEGVFLIIIFVGCSILLGFKSGQVRTNSIVTVVIIIGVIIIIIIIISYGNRTEWNPTWSLIIQVINKIGLRHSKSLICLITSMITDRIGRH